MTARYLVTGGAGFIGSNIAAALAARGDQVVICDWLGRDERWRNIAKHDLEDVVMPEELPQWLARRGRDLAAVVHMGAISATTETDVDLIVRRNIRATLDLWDWCAGNATPFVYASSAATYGDGTAGFDDDMTAPALAQLLPLNAYGWSKHFVDRRFGQILKAGEPVPPQWCGLKFFNVYGPNEYHKGTMKSVVAQGFERVVRGESLKLFKSYRAGVADGEQMRDFVYVRDCVDVILWLLEHHEVSGIFNVGSGKARSWIDLAHALFNAAGKPCSVEFVDMPETMRAKYQYFTQGRMDRLRTAGYDRQMTALEAGIADYVHLYLMKDDPYR